MSATFAWSERGITSTPRQEPVPGYFRRRAVRVVAPVVGAARARSGPAHPGQVLERARSGPVRERAHPGRVRERALVQPGAPAAAGRIRPAS
jgi:hypothetical protein